MRLDRPLLLAASTLLAVTFLTACGSSSAGTSSSAATAASAPAAGAASAGPGAEMPGASGEVAAVSGRTAQVQNDQSGQVAVTWTGSTSFSQQVAGTLDDVAVGSCVLVTSADDGSSSADASSDAGAVTAVTAGSVRVLAASGSDGCGFGGGGQLPSGGPTDMPSDMPSDRPGGMGGFGTSGEVIAVSATGFTVEAAAGPRSADSSAASVTVTVTVAVDTTYTTTAKATSAAVKVGRCLVAQGDADDTGAVTAASVTVSEPVDGTCTTGFGMGRPQGATS